VLCRQTEPTASRLDAIITSPSRQNCEPGRAIFRDADLDSSLRCKHHMKAVVCQFTNRY